MGGHEESGGKRGRGWQLIMMGSLFMSVSSCACKQGSLGRDVHLGEGEGPNLAIRHGAAIGSRTVDTILLRYVSI